MLGLNNSCSLGSTRARSPVSTNQSSGRRATKPFARQQPLFEEPALPPDPYAVAAFKYLLDDSWPCEWSEDDLVQLHWRLLLEIRNLLDPETPLDVKLDTLRWVFTDPEKDAVPFSFANCLRVVGCSPLSPTAYFGAVDVEDVRQWIRSRVSKWMRATLERYPHWARQLMLDNPEWVTQQLERNPQWLNEQIKSREGGDLFAPMAA